MKNNLIYKSNDLINASYSLSLNEQRLLLACISQLNSEVELNPDKPVVLTVADAQDLFYRENAQNAYRDLRKAVNALYERDLKLCSEESQENYMRTRWVQTVVFNATKQQIELHFSVGVLPYISQLKSNFTKYRLTNVAKLTSIYAIRIYEMIVMWYGQRQYSQEIEIDEFKQMLDIADKYAQGGQLKEFVIMPAIEQINAQTDFTLSIELKKVGRAFRYVQLEFKRKADAVAEDQARAEKRFAASKAKQIRTTKPKKSKSVLAGVTDLQAFYEKHRLGVESVEETFQRLQKEADNGTFSLNPTD